MTIKVRKYSRNVLSRRGKTTFVIHQVLHNTIMNLKIKKYVINILSRRTETTLLFSVKWEVCHHILFWIFAFRGTGILIR
jgi:ribosomal protein S24E